MFFIVSLKLRSPSWRPRSQFPLGLCKQNKAVIIQPSSTVQAVENATNLQCLHNMPISSGTDFFGPRHLCNAGSTTNPLFQPRAPAAPSAVGAALECHEGTSATIKSRNSCQHAWSPLLHFICSGRHGGNGYQSTWIVEMGDGVHVLAQRPDRAMHANPHTQWMLCVSKAYRRCVERI